MRTTQCEWWQTSVLMLAMHAVTPTAVAATVAVAVAVAVLFSYSIWAYKVQFIPMLPITFYPNATSYLRYRIDIYCYITHHLCVYIYARNQIFCNRFCWLLMSISSSSKSEKCKTDNNSNNNVPKAPRCYVFLIWHLSREKNIYILYIKSWTQASCRCTHVSYIQQIFCWLWQWCVCVTQKDKDKKSDISPHFMPLFCTLISTYNRL